MDVTVVGAGRAECSELQFDCCSKEECDLFEPREILVTWGSSVQIFRVIICAIAVGSLRIETCIKR